MLQKMIVILTLTSLKIAHSDASNFSLKSLNGKNISGRTNNISLGPINISKLKYRDHLIKGRVYFKVNGVLRTVRRHSVAMKIGNRIELISKITHNGEFTLKGKIKNSKYIIRVISNEFVGEKEILFEGSDLKDIEFIVERIESRM